ncbi:MAG: hypothetical protein AAFQ89_23660 [Cyanobacteria bacterium J06626_18]
MRNQSTTPWTPDQLVHMSESLASAYGIGLPVKKRQTKSDLWNCQRLLHLSAAKSFPID